MSETKFRNLEKRIQLCRCGHPYMPAHDTSCYGCSVEGCKCREFTPQGTPAWNESDYEKESEK